MTTPAPDSLDLQLLLPDQVPLGQAVPIGLRVRNRTERSLDLYLRGRATTFDVVVTGSDGETVWRRLEREIIPAIIHLRTLGPGEQFEVEAVWDQRNGAGRQVPRGEYTAQGFLLVEGDPLPSPSVALRITEGVK